MNVVLLAINAKYIHSSLSVWVIAGGVKKYARLAHDVSVVEATINQKDEEIVESVALHNPEVVGVSTYIWNARKLPVLLKLLRERLPETVFVFGGPEASHNAQFWIEQGADYVLPGEGEYSFPVLLDDLAEIDRKAEDTRNVENATIAENARNANNARNADNAENKAPTPTTPIDPYTDEFFGALNGRLSYIETSRGCPFRCSFCLSARSSLPAETSVRFFPLDIVKEQIHRLSKSGTHTVKFVDRTFNCNNERAYELFEYIIGMDTDCRFHFEVAADLFDERTLSLLASAPPGRIQFEIGLQSFHEPALEAVYRKTDLEKAEGNIRSLLQAKNIHIHVDLIAGLPYETLDDFKEGFDRAYLLGAHTLQLGFLKLLHGSVLREQAEALGIKYTTTPPYEITSSPWLCAEDIQTLKQTENALQHTYNKGRFLSTLKYVLKAAKLSPFAFMHALGTAVPNNGTQLEEYISQTYNFCMTLPGIDNETLCDQLTYDWLSMVKGKNTPTFLKNQDSRRESIQKEAEARLGRKVRRHEYASLNSGKGVFVDSNDRNPVTGLYQIRYTGEL